MLKIQHALPFVLLSACAVRQPGPRAWRFTSGTLIPPGVATPDLAQRTFTAPIRATADCLESDALTIRRRRSAITVTVHRDALLRQSRGWLTDLIDRAESQGCIPAGQGATLAARILESLPLPTGAAIRLLRDDGKRDFVDLIPGSRLQVISPILRANAASADLTAAPMQVSGQGNTINVDIKVSDDLLGVETAWYDLVPKPTGRGASIVPASARLNLHGAIEDRPAPATNLLQFAPQVGYYRLFYKADQSEILGIAATRAALPADPDACANSCFPIPRGVGVNPYMRIVVNGAPLTVPYSATVRTVLQAAKKRPEEVLPTLTISKPFAGRLVNIEFDRTKQEVLSLALTGDEQIRWE
jgi:hypothetical protein